VSEGVVGEVELEIDAFAVGRWSSFDVHFIFEIK
jgi:hypothetical protein